VRLFLAYSQSEGYYPVDAWPWKVNAQCFRRTCGEAVDASRKLSILFVRAGSYIPHEFLVTHAAGSPPVYENSWVQRLNQEGFSVCGLDQQVGHRMSRRSLVLA